MNDDFISNILDSLERNMHISQENIDDFIGTLFEQRAEDMHTSVTKSGKNKKEYVVNLSREKLEKLYDQTFDMILGIYVIDMYLKKK